MPETNDWKNVPAAPIVVVHSKESVLADRMVDSVIAQVRATDPSTSVTRLEADAYEEGQLGTLTSPSLFGEPAVIVVNHCGMMNDGFYNDAMAYLKGIEPHCTVVLRFGDGQRGKKLVDAVKHAGFPVVASPVMSNDNHKVNFVIKEVRSAGRQITPDAARLLVDALGQRVGDLVAGLNQLLTDFDGKITLEVVRTYYAGRIEAQSFDIADAAVAGKMAEALSLARHSVATGGSAVAIIAALTTSVSNIALSLRGYQAQYKMDPTPSFWGKKSADRNARGWSHDGLAVAIQALAQADAEAKGASLDAEFAMERAIIKVCEARRMKGTR